MAGYDDWQWRQVLCRRRDPAGKLLRGEDHPPWVEVDENGMRVVTNPVPLGVAFRQVMQGRGADRLETELAWQRWLKDNPHFGRSNHEDN